MQFNLHHAPGVVSRLIRWQTRGRWSHVSCTLRDGTVIEAREFKGVRSLPKLTPAKGERIDLFDLPMSADQEAALEQFLTLQLGKGYDYLAILRFITRKPVPHWKKKRWFCSELQFEAARFAGVALLDRIEAWAVSPELFGISPRLVYRQTISDRDDRAGRDVLGLWRRFPRHFFRRHTGPRRATIAAGGV